MKKTILFIMLFWANQLIAQNTNSCISGNCITGSGKMVYAGVDSGHYEGSFVNGLKHGKGTFEDKWLIYTGEWKDDRYDGQGKLSKKMTYRSKGKYSEDYSGNFKNGQYNGEGLWVYYINGDSTLVYKGGFKDGQRFGTGSLRFPGMNSLYSDSWTDNGDFTFGKNISEDKKTIREGRYVNLNFEESKQPGNASPQSASSAQSGFKTINFHKANSTVLRQNVLQSELVSTLSSAKSGAITLNTKSGEIIISASGEDDKVYKIKTVGGEVTDKWGNKTITINCSDANNIACEAVIKKQYAFTTSNEMLFNITYANGTGKGYICDYQANLYEN